jgi:hypothetical protein
MARNKRKPAAAVSPTPAGLTALPWWLALGIIATVYVLLRINAIGIPLDRDEGVFAYAGQRILEGELPFRDVVDHKPPGVFYLYALALLLVPPTPEGVHRFLHAYNFLTLLAVWFLMKRLFPSRWAPFCGAFCFAIFSASPAIQGFTASAEMLMLLPIVISLLLTVVAATQPSKWLLLASGAAGAVACWIKPTAVASIAFVVVYLAVSAWRTNSAGSPSKGALLRVFWWCAGGAIVTGAVAAYFAAAGIFPAFVYWSFTHSLAYANQVTVSETISRWIKAMGTIARGDFAIGSLGLLTAFWYLRRRRDESLFVLGFLLFSLAGTVPGFAYPHYFAQAAPAVAIASGWALAIFFRLSSAWFRPLTAAAAAVALVLIPVWVHADYFLERSPDLISRRIFGSNPFPESAELSEYLASRTSAQDRIFIFGSEPQILIQAKRKSATPFVIIYPLMSEYPRYLEFQERVWQDVVKSSPAYILVVNIPTSTLWDGRADLKIQERLGELIQTRYQFEAVMPVHAPKGHLVVLRNGQPPPPEIANNPFSISVYRLSLRKNAVSER